MVLRLKSGPDGKVLVDVGAPNAEVELTYSVKPGAYDDAAWKAEMRKLLDGMGEVHVEEYPRTPMRDPWEDK
jgi:hypothetical protein